MYALIVEDDLMQAREVMNALDGAGFSCDYANSTHDAMSMVRRSPYDLIILDIFVNDGMTADFSDFIKMRHPQTAILAITGSGIFEKGEHVSAMSVDYLMRKPVSLGDLVEVSKYLMSSRAIKTDPISASGAG